MERKHIAMYGLKDFVKTILGKRLMPAASPADETTNPVRQLIAKTREELEKQGIKGGDIAQRASLAELIVPDVLKPEGPDKKLVKQWAFSLGHMLGLLVAMSIPEDEIDLALNEVTKEAKRVAKQATQFLAQLASRGLQKRPARKKATDAYSEYRTQMIVDLESQAMIESDPAAKAALQAHANRLKKEAELEKVA